MQEESIDLHHYVGMVLRWWWVLILSPIAIGALFYWQFGSPELLYETSSTILVQQTRSSAIPTLLDMQTSQRLTATYQHIITTGPVLEKAAQEITNISGTKFSQGGLRSLVRAEVVPSTQLLQVVVVYTDPEMAALIAQIVSEVFIEETQQAQLVDIARLQAAAVTQGISSSGTLLEAQLTALSSLSIIDPAVMNTSPLPTNTTRTVVAGTVMGLLIAVVVVFTLEYLTDKVRTVEEVERSFGLTSLGVVLRWPREEIPAGLVFKPEYATSGYAEIFRQVRANFQFAIAAHSGMIYAVTSSGPSEGKTTVLTNLGVALALMGKRVVVVDSDLRRPAVHKVYEVDNLKGLSTLLSEPDTPLSDVIKVVQVGDTKINLITSGPIPPNPAELLGSGNMERLLERMKPDYDLILLDSPPVGVVADSMIIASQADGVLLIAVLGETKARALRESLRHLDSAGGVLLGVLFNKIKLPRMRYGYHYRRYYNYYSAQDGGQGTSGSNRDTAMQANGRQSVLGAPWRLATKLLLGKR